MEAWCEHCNIIINKDKTWAIYFSHRCTLVVAHCTLNEWNIPFVRCVKYKYLAVIFDKWITCRFHIESIEAKVF
jgi:hypothetical protein